MNDYVRELFRSVERPQIAFAENSGRPGLKLTVRKASIETGPEGYNHSLLLVIREVGTAWEWFDPDDECLDQ